MRYCREVSTAGKAEVKDPEAASMEFVDDHKPSVSIGAPGQDVYAPLNSSLGEETSDCWPAATELDLPVRLDPHLSFSSIADTFRSAYEPPRASSIADSCLVDMLFDALNSGDDEACTVAAKARLTCDVWDDLEADIDADTETVYSTDSSSVCSMDSPSVYSAESIMMEVPYLDLMLLLPLPPDLCVPPIVGKAMEVKAMEPEPVFSSSASASYYCSIDDWSAVGLAF
ncbi:hypothetical protein IEO21_05966 [Rhodonia placenta]|uniref:Uncharacterized protein n=1 Tax=Rhodonia placenta TaxID=104341 RepID=A0A8H7U1S0_9APHY|nr:hypothetical protein IEO21_05966 [Postia placenta]